MVEYLSSTCEVLGSISSVTSKTSLLDEGASKILNLVQRAFEKLEIEKM
jgi:hypothetical protein